MPLLSIIAACFFLSVAAPVRAAAPEHVRLTWMSVSNWLIEVGQTRIVLDGYISRIPEAAFSGPSFAYAEPSLPDTAAIQRVIEALGNPRIDCILTGHSHYDHSFDTATWARLTGARIIGARSTCLQAVAQGVPDARCTAVEGGELIPLGPYVSVRVIRWNHSGDTTTFEGKLLHAPLELTAPPTPTSAGLRPGTLQDFPNGGGARAYLFTAQTASGPVHWLYSNTGNATTFDQPVTIDEAFFSQRELALDTLRIAEHATPAREHLRAALEDADLERVDLWLGFSDRPLAQAVHPILRPKAHIPHHWDGLFSPFFDGVPYAYSAFPMSAGVADFWEEQRVSFLPPRQYMDAYRLTTTGVRPVANPTVKQRLGLSDPPSPGEHN